MHRIAFLLRRIPVVVITALGAACASDRPTGPNLPVDHPELLDRAIILHIDLRTAGISTESAQQDGGSAVGPKPSMALVGGDGIGVVTSNFSRSPVGQFIKDKVRIRFDVALVNKLQHADLVTPTFPPPPTNVQGVILFPFSLVVQSTLGGKAKPSIDWDGEAFNFFNDVNCSSSVNSDCYRWEAYPSPLEAGVTSAARTVGFDADPDVVTITVYMVLAADVRERPLPGAIAGTVTSSTRGSLSGVTVTAAPGGASATTDANGAYSIGGVATGSVNVSLGALPSGCTSPGAQPATVGPGAVTTVNFTVSCTPLTGTVGGTVTSPSFGPLAGVTVKAGGNSATTSGAGAYSIAGVPVGQQAVTLDRLSSDCLNPGAQVAAVTANATTTLDFTVNCTTPTGSVVGVVSSAVGPLSNVNVVVSVGGIALADLTDAAGLYHVSGVPVGAASVSVSGLPSGCSNPTAQTVTVAKGGTVTANFAVGCAGSIQGSIFWLNGGSPVGLGGLQVVVAPANLTGLTLPSGSFFLSGVPVGSVTITVATPVAGCSAPSPQATVLPGQAVNIPILLVCTGRISGTVSLAGGDGLAGVGVSIISPPPPRTAFTSLTGAYELDDVPVGPTAVAATSLPTGCTPAVDQTVDLFPGTTRTVNFTAACTGTIAGSVTSPERGALNGVVVSADQGGPRGITGSNGAYSIPGVNIGSHSVALTNLPTGCSDPGPQSTTISVGGSATVSFSVHCGPITGFVEGSVVALGYQGVPGGFTVSINTTPTPTTVTGTSIYRVEVPVGSYVVTLAVYPSTCDAPAPQTSAVTAGASVQVNFVLNCPGELSGRLASPQLGALDGVEVLATASSGARYSTTTRGGGGFDMFLPADQYAVEIGSGLPAACATPAPASVVVRALAPTSVSFTADCSQSGPVRGLVINEIDYHQPGLDNAEFVEIYNNTGASVDLSRYALVFVGTTTNTEYLRVPLGQPVASLAPGQFLVVASPSVVVDPAAVRVTLPGPIHNGPPGAVGILDLEASRLVDALSWGGAIHAGVLLGGLTLDFVEPAGGPGLSLTDPGPGSLIRLPDGADTDDANADWRLTLTPTPGAPNFP